ncbi:aminoacrylate peracid reductase [Gallibacterium salpingitidis]|uniref:Aminoacrylate peracid reductase n=1 Tax=Gallibacterium salpingitidis TaxID=505341 RepID=A0AB36E6F3_9PAST|nr:RidA family protein [Gallibacterium salpingitidis]OBX10667.1 aminoacrylate peracid reductase [Gallibacterium salpingitidis]WKT00241.1 RidA family protein [Gallibacterium salpingitidis]
MKHIDAGARLSEAVVYGGIAYLAGQVPEDTSLDAYGQTKQVLQFIDNLLEQSNSDKSRILRAEIFLADMSDYAEMNRAWDEWVIAGAAPARSTIEAKLANPEWKVEIVITAACK